MARAFFPLDEELQLLPGHLTPSVHEGLVRLSTWMPFARAAREGGWFLKVNVTESLTRRLAETAGAAYVHVQTAEVERLERTTPEPPAGPELQLLSVDGAMVPLVKGEWAEVKTLVVGTVQPPVLEKGEPVVHTTDLSYFSRLTTAEEFGRWATVETHRRGVERAKRSCAVTDGADWEQGFIDLHRRDAVRILDFPHAAEHLTLAGQAVHGHETAAFETWWRDQLHELKHGSADCVLEQLRAMQRDALTAGAEAQAHVVQDNLAYLEKRRAHLAYAEFQAHGYPIGSGAVESANKVVVEVRLKGAGMHWARAHVNPMVALRTIACSDRWDEAWPQIERQLRQQEQSQREQHRQQRRAKRRAVAELPQSSRPADAVPKPPTAQATPPTAERQLSPHGGKAHRPADNHPWRHMPVGRAVLLPRKKRASAKV